MRLVVAVAVAAVLAACTGNPAKDSLGDQPVAQQTAADNNTQRAKAHANLGMAYVADGRLSVALDEARQALAADSNYPLAQNLMAVVQMALGENYLAEQYFERAVRLAPTDPEINNNYGWFLCQTGRQQQAYPYFETAARHPLYAYPTTPLTNAGICAAAIKDDKAAEQYFLRAIKLDAGNSAARNFLASLYYRNGRYEDAYNQLKEMGKVAEPTAASTWLGARVARKLADREGEARYLSLLRRKFKESPEYQKYLQGSEE